MSNESAGNSYCFFGKLPQYPDFIKYKATSEGFILFDNWLQKGIASAKLNLGSNWKEYYSNSSCFDFFFPVQNSDYVLVGVLQPSFDKSNRQFPFLVFTELGAAMFNTDVFGSMPLILNSLYYRAKQLYSAALKSFEVNEIVSELYNTEVRLNSVSAANKIFTEYLESTTVGDFLYRTNIETSIGSKAELSDAGSITLRYITDEDYYNFDTGFAIYFMSILYNRLDRIPYFFKTINSDGTAELFIYFNHPDFAEFTRLISGDRSTVKIKNSLLNDNNPHISLKKYIDENLLH